MIPPDRCPQIVLDAEERAQYDTSARKFLQEAMAEYAKLDPRRRSLDAKRWAFVRKRGEVRVYRSVRGALDPAVLPMLGTGLVDGSIEDVMNGLYCETSAELFVAKVLLGYPLAEGSVLNASEVHSDKDPFRFAGIKWFACKKALGFLTQRDVLTYERMGSALDGHGQELAYHTLQSIRRPEWPTEATPGMQRQHTATCYLYRPRRDLNKTEVFLWGSILKFGGAPEKLLQLGVASTWLNVVRSPESGRAKKFSALADTANTHQWLPSSHECHICSKRPMLANYSPCTGCHQSVCRDCSQSRAVFELDHAGKPKKRRFCISCVTSVVGKAVRSIKESPRALPNLAGSQTDRSGRTRSANSDSNLSFVSDAQSLLADPFRPRVSSDLRLSDDSGMPLTPPRPSAELTLDW